MNDDPGLAPGFVFSARDTAGTQSKCATTAQAATGNLVGMDDIIRFQRLATRFLIALLERHGQEAPAVLRAWTDEIGGLAGEGEERSRLT
jgi:hypothetical protein